MDEFGELDMNYEPGRSGDKPFLPDTHLKSPITDHYLKDIQSILNNKNLIHPNRTVNKDRDSILTILNNWIINGSTSEWYKYLIIGIESVKHYPYFWDLKNFESADKKIKEKNKQSWNKFLKYDQFSRHLMKDHLKDLFKAGDKDTLEYTLILNHAEKLGINPADVSKEIKEKFRLLSTELNKENKLMYNEISNKFHNIKLSDNLVNKFFNHERLQLLKSQIIRSQIEKQERMYSFSLFHLKDSYYNNRIVMIKISDNTFLLLNTDQLLMLSDVATSRFLVYYTTIQYLQVDQSLLPSQTVLDDIYMWMDNVLSALGNEGYSVLKYLEPMCTAVFLNEYDPLEKSHLFLDNIKKDTNPDYLIYLNQLEMILVRSCSPNAIFEIFGLYRHAGHPIVDEIQGCKAMKEVSREQTKIKETTLMECVGASKKNFLLEYIKKNKYWPNINIDLTVENFKKLDRKNNQYHLIEFQELLTSKPLNINEYDTYFPLIVWSTIRFSKTFQYNDYEDVTALLSDTAISPTRNHWTQLYRQCKLRLNCVPDYTYSRRTLINLLKRSRFSMTEIRSMIQEKRIPKMWKIIAIHAKERELKIKARLFSMMVLEMRMYFACSEKNISDSIFPYVPTQTMTNSEAELTQKLLHLTNLNKRLKHVIILISLDFDKFNQRWRYDSTFLHFQMLDDLFGTEGLYIYSHRFFEESWICLASVDNPPQYLRKQPRDISQLTRKDQNESSEDILLSRHNLEKESDTTWKGQGGGFEGLRQKGWTFCITGMLETLYEKTGLKSYIIGQGDNQFIVLMLPIRVPGLTESQYISNHQPLIEKDLGRYMETLEEVSNGLGMKLKLEETWCSTRLMNYGKEILVDGCYTTSILKRASRAYSEVNDIYPTLSKRISSLYSSCHSVSSKSFEFLIPYHMAQVLSIHMIDEEFRGRGLTNWDRSVFTKKWLQKLALEDDTLFNKDEFEILSMLNKEIGGYPCLPISEFMYRGHPDPISCYLSILQPYTDNLNKNKIMAFILRNFSKNISNKVNLRKLIQDPTSWNWKNHYADTGRISDLLESYLRQLCNNIEINKLFHAMDDTESDRVIDFLGGTKPFIPRVCNEIYRHTPEGAKYAYLSSFSDMKTVRELMSPQDGNSLITLINYHENLILNNVLTMLDEILGTTPLTVEERNTWVESFSLSEIITNVMWGRAISGSRIPHPAQQTMIVRATDAQCNFCELELSTFKERITYLIPKTQLEDDHDTKISYQCLEDLNLLQEHINSDKSMRARFYYHRGDFTPYIGSTTREKRSRSLINFPRGDRALSSAQSLQRIRDWVVESGSNLDKFVENVIKSRTDLPIELIQLSSGKHYGGSIVHRFHDVITKHSSRPNSRPNFFSQVYLSGDDAGEYSGGGENYNIHFQSNYLFGFSLINLIAYWTPTTIDSQYHLHFINYTSIKLSDVPKMRADDIPPKIKNLSNSKILFTSKSDYVDKCYEFETKAHLAMQSNVDSITLKRRAHQSAGTIIFHHFLENCNPVIQIHDFKQSAEIVKSPLTINDVVTLDLKLVMNYVGKLWLLHHISNILKIQKNYTVDLYSIIYVIIHKLPNDCLKFIKNLINHHSLRDQILDQFDWPTSSDFVKNASSFEKVFLTEIYIGAIQFLENPHPLTEIYPYESLTYNRWIILYIHAYLIMINKGSFLNLDRDISVITKEAYKILTSQSKDLREIIKLLSSVPQEETTDKIVIFKLPQISYFGCEPWIKFYKDSLCSTSQTKIAPSISKKKPLMISTYDEEKELLNKRINASKQSIRVLKEITTQLVPSFFLEIEDNIIEPNYKHKKDLQITNDYPLDEEEENIDSLITRSIQKKRFTHQFRLTGRYSTAHYKYVEIFRFIDSDNFEASINLAEGVGGLSKLTSQYFNTSIIIYNSLFDLSEFASQKATSYMPPELINTTHHLLGRIYGVRESIVSGGDITLDKTIKLYEDLIKKLVHRKSILTMDAELDERFTLDYGKLIIKNVIKLFNLLPLGSWLVFKTFYKNFNAFEIMVGIFLDKYKKIILIKPKMSSVENTEIFILIKYKTKVNHVIRNDIRINLKTYFLKYILDRKKDYLPLDETIQYEYHKSFFQLGFHFNLIHSLKILTGNLINIKDFKLSPISTVTCLIDSVHTMMVEFLRISGKDLQQQRLTDLDKSIRLTNLKESFELKNLGNVLVNAYLIRDYLIFGHKTLLIPTFNLTIIDPLTRSNIPNNSVYTVVTDIPDWLNLYSRHFQRLIGFLHTPNMWHEAMNSDSPI